MNFLLGLLLLPLYLLLVWACGVLIWEQLVAGWHSGAVPTALACVVLGFALLLCGSKKRPV